ncbi:hypothetical protein HYDPIDRAFT_85510 [Hydnomerulius pinastri MD-312]|nr:hypothetical protein HYDPIDRAFT_85510 [Hydnomerulius pinastri MD-312]
MKGTKVALPPGPSGLPILGNILDIPASEPWVAYKCLGEKYGDLVHIRLLTQDAIVLNSLESAKALLEQRSQNYSNRPYIAMKDLMGINWHTAFMPYSDEWRLHRRIFQQALRAEGVAVYRPMQMRRAYELVKNMLEAPSDYAQHFRMHSSAIIMSATYAYELATRDDPMLEKVTAVNELIISGLSPEVSAVIGAFPFLTRIPPWFPGATVQRTAAATRKLVGWWLEGPFQYVQTRMTQGTFTPCIVGDALARIDEGAKDADDIKQAIRAAAATSFAAGSETTDSALRTFLLAMVLYPEVQKRAQDEIQAVVGSERLPDFSDRASLPYVEAILRESQRWHPVAPLSVPHSNVHDDIYRGYFIPKGVTIIPNVWAMAHDETRYPEPFAFNPGRFFKDTGVLNDDTVSYTFGFGRRICIGRHLADASMWSAIADLLAAFKFEAPLDGDGLPIKITPRFTTGLTSHPEHFPVKVTPRFDPQKLAALARIDE